MRFGAMLGIPGQAERNYEGTGISKCCQVTRF